MGAADGVCLVTVFTIELVIRLRYRANRSFREWLIYFVVQWIVYVYIYLFLLSVIGERIFVGDTWACKARVTRKCKSAATLHFHVSRKTLIRGIMLGKSKEAECSTH